MNSGFAAPGRLRQSLTKLTVVLAAFVVPPSANAECFDGAKHFRGGQWKEWILQMRPGSIAVSKAEQIINEINTARAASQLAPLTFSKDNPIVFGVIDETNARGPSGERLKNRPSNQELFFATFAALPSSKPVIVFISDPLRSNSELTTAGVPGREASFAVETKVERRGVNSVISTKWIAQNDTGDDIQFSARYTSADVSATNAGPPPTEYLLCNMINIGSMLFRSLPLQVFSFFDRLQASVINDFGKPNVQVDLKLKLADPVLDAIFNDPDNLYLRLIEVDRVIRLER